MYAELSRMMMVDDRGMLVKPPPPKVVTEEAIKPFVIVVWNNDSEDMWVYGPYACRHDAVLAADKLVIFTPHAIIRCEDIDDG